jgi:hypothetical protein
VWVDQPKYALLSRSCPGSQSSSGLEVFRGSTVERSFRRHSDEYGYCSYLYRDVNGEVFRPGLRLFASALLAHALASTYSMLKEAVRHASTGIFITYTSCKCLCSMLSSFTCSPQRHPNALCPNALRSQDTNYMIESPNPILQIRCERICESVEMVTRGEVTLYSCCV